MRWRGALAAVLACVAGIGVLASPPDAGEVPAEVLPIRDVRVPAEVPGRVVARPEDETGTVRAGEPVVTLDDALLRAAAEAAQASVERARAQREWAQLERERVQSLFDRGSVGASDLDRATLALREAETGLTALQAAAEEARIRLDRTVIRAPFDGRLVRILPERGEYLQTGQTAFRIIDDSSLRVIAYLPGHLLERVRPGTEVRLLPEAGEPAAAGPEAQVPTRPTLPLRVFSVAPAAEGRARTFRLEARGRDEGGRWRPGMRGRLQLPSAP